MKFIFHSIVPSSTCYNYW